MPIGHVDNSHWQSDRLTMAIASTVRLVSFGIGSAPGKHGVSRKRDFAPLPLSVVEALPLSTPAELAGAHPEPAICLTFGSMK